MTFDVASPFDFDKTTATVTDWLGSSSAFNIVENTAGTLASLMDGGGVGTIVNFLGSVSVTNGQQFTVTHDDGLSLIIDGNLVISAPGPTSPTTGTYTYTGATGTFPFNWSTQNAVGGQLSFKLTCRSQLSRSRERCRCSLVVWDFWVFLLGDVGSP